jgi:dTDP-4-amino-4,6-dideoxygalactose transaminase
VLRGATPVFVDVRPGTLNIDADLIEAAVTPRSRAIVAVHYAGVACDMDAITDIAGRHGLVIVEDAAQALLSSYKGRALGSIGHLAAFSFHETKNVISGEGGALAINDERYLERAEILWQKGTNRSAFARGTADKYTWVDIGSSFLPGELVAAFLLAQLERAHEITAERLASWGRYLDACAPLRALGVDLPSVPAECVHNGHLFRVLLPQHISRTETLQRLNDRGINAVFHYVPLHSSPAGRRFGRVASPMDVTDDCSARLLRLPLWSGLGADVPARVAAELTATVLAHA